MANKARAENGRMADKEMENNRQCREQQTKTGLKLLEKDRGENGKQMEDGRQGQGTKNCEYETVWRMKDKDRVESHR